MNDKAIKFVRAIYDNLSGPDVLQQAIYHHIIGIIREDGTHVGGANYVLKRDKPFDPTEEQWSSPSHHVGDIPLQNVNDEIRAAVLELVDGTNLNMVATYSPLLGIVPGSVMLVIACHEDDAGKHFIRYEIVSTSNDYISAEIPAIFREPTDSTESTDA